MVKRINTRTSEELKENGEHQFQNCAFSEAIEAYRDAFSTPELDFVVDKRSNVINLASGAFTIQNAQHWTTFASSCILWYRRYCCRYLHYIADYEAYTDRCKKCNIIPVKSLIDVSAKPADYLSAATTAINNALRIYCHLANGIAALTKQNSDDEKEPSADFVACIREYDAAIFRTFIHNVICCYYVYDVSYNIEHREIYCNVSKAKAFDNLIKSIDTILSIKLDPISAGESRIITTDTAYNISDAVDAIECTEKTRLGIHLDSYLASQAKAAIAQELSDDEEDLSEDERTIEAPQYTIDETIRAHQKMPVSKNEDNADEDEENGEEDEGEDDGEDDDESKEQAAELRRRADTFCKKLEQWTKIARKFAEVTVTFPEIKHFYLILIELCSLFSYILPIEVYEFKEQIYAGISDACQSVIQTQEYANAKSEMGNKKIAAFFKRIASKIFGGNKEEKEDSCDGADKYCVCTEDKCKGCNSNCMECLETLGNENLKRSMGRSIINITEEGDTESQIVLHCFPFLKDEKGEIIIEKEFRKNIDIEFASGLISLWETSYEFDHIANLCDEEQEEEECENNENVEEEEQENEAENKNEDENENENENLEEPEKEENDIHVDDLISVSGKEEKQPEEIEEKPQKPNFLKSVWNKITGTDKKSDEAATCENEKDEPEPIKEEVADEKKQEEDEIEEVEIENDEKKVSTIVEQQEEPNDNEEIISKKSLKEIKKLEKQRQEHEIEMEGLLQTQRIIEENIYADLCNSESHCDESEEELVVSRGAIKEEDLDNDDLNVDVVKEEKSEEPVKDEQKKTGELTKSVFRMLFRSKAPTVENEPMKEETPNDNEVVVPNPAENELILNSGESESE